MMLKLKPYIVDLLLFFNYFFLDSLKVGVNLLDERPEP